MSFLFKKVAAQDANGDEVIARRNGYSLVYNPVNNGYWFYSRNGEGIGLPRVANKQAAMIEFNRLVDGAQDSCGKDAAQDSLPTVGGYITLKKDGKKYKILKDWGGGEYIVADPNGGDFQVKYYEHLEGLKHYGKDAAQDGNSEFIIEHSRIPIAQIGGVENAKKSGYIVAKKNGRTYGVHIDGYSDELTRRTLKDAGYAFDGCEGKDTAEFKVGDKVKHTQYGTIGKVFEIDPAGNVGVQWNNGQAYYGKTAKPLSLIVAADSAAMDAITESDLKKHAYNFARYELGKYADELRKKRNSLADLWERTSIAGGAIRSGKYKQADIDEFVNPYVNAIDDAIRILERI